VADVTREEFDALKARVDKLDPPPVISTRRIPLVSGRSGGSKLPFNLIGFQGGPATMGVVSSMSTMLGRPFDGGLTFVPRGDWSQLASTEYIKGAKSILDAGGTVVLTTPHLPTKYGDDMNRLGALNTYAADQKTLAAKWAAGGLNSNRVIIRWGWEFNGSWYEWSANRGGGKENFKTAGRNFVDNMRAGGLNQVKFEQSANGDKSQSGATLADVFLGSKWTDIVTVDQYDQWPASFSQSTWNGKMSTVDSIDTTAKLARDNDIMWGIAECGNVWQDLSKNFGKDNPLYWEFLAATIKKNLALKDNMGYLTIYSDDGEPDTNHHTLDKYNPLSLAKLRTILATW
jgi:hypothetical protein